MIKPRVIAVNLRRLLWKVYWKHLPRRKAESWYARAAFASSKLTEVDGVADMGCGWMTLERYLAPGVKYIPVDLVKRDARTVVCDFDKQAPPDTGVSAAACLGLLGYLRDPQAFMAGLSRNYRYAFVSYKASDLARTTRRPPGYTTALSSSACEEMFAAAGWKVEERYIAPRAPQMMWLLVSDHVEHAC